MRNPLSGLSAAAQGFRRDASGATAIVFAICAVPTIGMVGLGIDYMQGLSYKRRFDAAADSAALAAIAGAQAYWTANQSSMSASALASGAVTAGQNQGKRAFAVNGGGYVDDFALTSNVVVTPPNQVDPATGVMNGSRQFTASATYGGAMPTSFGKIFGTKALNLGGTSGSSMTLGSYLDFYLALDVSGSMGLATSTDDQTKLSAINTDNKTYGYNYPHGCAFACHFPAAKGYSIAHSNGIKLRVDSVATAVSGMISTAKSTATLTNQFRIGVYPFIDNVMQAAAISTDFSAAQTVANTLGDNYLDAGNSTSINKQMGSGGTHFENVMAPFYNYITAIGDGSTSQKAKPFLFIVTDGMDNNQSYDGSNWSSGGSQPKEPNNFGYCDYARQYGVTVAILYIPYIKIAWPVAQEDTDANNVIPKIPADLQACAAPGFFFTANTDADIKNALQTMFAQALQAARLTK